MSMTEGTPPAGTPRRTALWKRLALIGASLGVGLAAVAALVGLNIHWYYSHPRPTRKWPDLDIRAYGLKVSLKTRWRDNALHYQLKISPLSRDGIDAFDASFRSLSEPLQLSLFLYDDAGFRVCLAPTDRSDVKHDLDDKGRIASLTVDATWVLCSYEHYRDSRKWNLAWKNLPTAVPSKEPNKATEVRTSEGTDTITGVDSVTGELDTKSGRVFFVYSSAEQYTIIPWSAKQRLHFSCRAASDCTLENTDRGETVHARLGK